MRHAPAVEGLSGEQVCSTPPARHNGLPTNAGAPTLPLLDPPALLLPAPAAVPLEAPFQPVAALPLVTVRLPLPPASLTLMLPLALLVPLDSPVLGTTVIGVNPAPPELADPEQPTADRAATVQKTASTLIESVA
jgi:hypothetical protein